MLIEERSGSVVEWFSDLRLNGPGSRLIRGTAIICYVSLSKTHYPLLSILVEPRHT